MSTLRILSSNSKILSEGNWASSGHPRQPNERYVHKNFLTTASKASTSRMTSSICSRVRSRASESCPSSRYRLTASPYFPCLPRITARVAPRSCSTTNSIISSSSSLNRSAALLREREIEFGCLTNETYSSSFDSKYDNRATSLIQSVVSESTSASCFLIIETAVSRRLWSKEYDAASVNKFASLNALTTS